MLKCHWHIFLTYCRRKMFWLTGPMLVGGLVFLYGPDQQHRAKMFGTNMPHLSFGFLIMYFFASVIIHLKQQIASPRASLVPRYRLPHLSVAAWMISPVLLLVPWIASARLGIPFLPIFSHNLAFCALLALGVYRNSFPLMMLVMACWFAPGLPLVHGILVPFLTDGNLPTSLFLLIAGTLGFAFLARRLLCLTEEMPEYARNIPTNGWDSIKNLRSYPTSSQVNFQSRWQLFFAGPGERQFERLKGWSDLSRWQRVARWRIVTGRRHASRFMGLLIVLIQIILGHYFGSGNLTFIRGYLLVFPAIFSLGAFFLRLPMLGCESLRPAPRSEFLIDQALGVTLQVAETWLGMMVALLIGLAITTPDSLGQLSLWIALGVAFLFQALELSVMFWLMRFRSPGIFFVIILPMFALIPFGMKLSMLSPAMSLHAMVMMALIALAAILLSLLILRDAYRRWLQTDLA